LDLEFIIMTKENWGTPGMPPQYFDVLDRWVICHSPDGEQRTEYIWIRGKHPHFGRVIERYQGTETFVEKYVNGTERILRDLTNIPDYHPLYNSSNNGNGQEE